VAADNGGLVLEDPDAYHRAFPDNPVPGRAIAVLRGTEPDGSVFRVVFHTAREEMTERAAVLLAAPEGGPTGPREPRFEQSAGMWSAKAGDVVAGWAAETGPIGSADADIAERGRQALMAFE
jgi:hypothetical protein